MKKKNVQKKQKRKAEKQKTKMSIQQISFDDTWIKAFGRGYSGPCSGWCY